MEQHIRAWLESHPDFFTRNPELLPKAIQAAGKVIRLEDGQLDYLRRQNETIREQLESMLERIEHNERIYQTFHAIQVQMVNASTLTQLVVTVVEEMEKCFAITRVAATLGKSNTPFGLKVSALALPDAIAERLFIVEQAPLERTLGLSGKPLIRIGLEGVDRELYFGHESRSIRSEALVPLMDPASDGSRLIGSLNLGGATPSRFLPSFSTDLLQNLATIFALCLKNLVLADRV